MPHNRIALLKKALASDLEKGLTELEGALAPQGRAYDEYLLLNGRYSETRRKYRLGVLSEEQYNLVMNQLRLALLDLVNELGPEDLRNVSNDDDPAALRMFPWKTAQPFHLETFDAVNQENPVFHAYQEDLWSAGWERGAYVLRNREDPTAVRYHYLTINDRNMAELPVTVEVQIEAEDEFPKSGAGLLCCFDAGTRNYYAFFVNNDQEFNCWLREEGGFTPLFSGRCSLIRPRQFNKLGVIRKRDLLFLFINDEYVREIKNDKLASGDSGIIAFGKGVFRFDNLAFFENTL